MPAVDVEKSSRQSAHGVTQHAAAVANGRGNGKQCDFGWWQTGNWKISRTSDAEVAAANALLRKWMMCSGSRVMPRSLLPTLQIDGAS